MTADLTYLSLGAGVQSTAMLVMSNEGLDGCPRADVAIFADTHAEPPWVYEHLARLESYSKIPIHRVSAGSLPEQIRRAARGETNRFGSIPAFTDMGDGRPGMLRRQCTREYKIEPIEKEVRRLLGYAKGERVKKSAIGLLGISTDEAQRMKPARTPWIRHEFPLIDAGMSRRDCERLLVDRGFEIPKKSACVFCPFRSDAEWRQIRSNPEAWALATEIDEKIRNVPAAGVERPVYLHRSCRPLATAPFDGDPNQRTFTFLEECEGMCGV